MASMDDLMQTSCLPYWDLSDSVFKFQGYFLAKPPLSISNLRVEVVPASQYFLQQPYSNQNGRRGKHGFNRRFYPHIRYSIDNITPYIGYIELQTQLIIVWSQVRLLPGSHKYGGIQVNNPHICARKEPPFRKALFTTDTLQL
jgi:hypothetical protein